MLNFPNLPLFLVASIILIITPGPAVIYIVTRSIDQGRLAGFVSVLSIETGNFVHVIAVTLGLSAILLSSAFIFSIIKMLGAFYLVYLGVRRIITKESILKNDGTLSKKLLDIYRQGVVVAIFNPKTAMFFIAFLPQFIDPTRGSIAFQLFTLGCIFVLMAVCSDGLYSVLAGTVGKWLKETPIFMTIEKYIFGCIYIGLGITAAILNYHK